MPDVSLISRLKLGLPSQGLSQYKLCLQNSLEMSADLVLSRNFQPPKGSKGLETLLVAMAAAKIAAHKNFWIALCIQTCFEIQLKINSFSSIKEPITDFLSFPKLKNIRKSLFSVPFVLKPNHVHSVMIFQLEIWSSPYKIFNYLFK